MILKEEKICRLRLLRSPKIGNSTYWNLIKLYGSAQTAVEMLPELAKNAGNIGYSVCPISTIDNEIEKLKNANVRLVFFNKFSLFSFIRVQIMKQAGAKNKAVILNILSTLLH